MGNSTLTNYVVISPHKTKRTAKITKITIHHMAGNLSVERCGAVFCGSRAASSNYGVDGSGRIGLYVPEDYRSYASSNRANDNSAVTIEVANCGGAPNWPVSDTALEATIKLCVDICKRNGIKQLNYTGTKSGNLTRHNMFAATTCPGSYLQSKFPYIAAEVNKRLNGTVEIESKKPTVRDWQLAAIADGYKFPKYGADGEWGAECEAVAEKAIVKKRLYYANQNLTKIVQRCLGIEVDGKCGNATKAAIVEYQRANTLEADGAVGLNTWKALLDIK